MAIATSPTLLPLDEYAKIMGVNPVHFNQGYGDNVFPLKNNRCADLWPQFSWQYYDHISRESIAREIEQAEMEIAEVLGYWPAPKWIVEDVRMFPRYHRRDMWRAGGNVRGGDIGITTTWGELIGAGQRATSLVGTATTAGGELTYVFGTTLEATIILPTTLTDVNEVKVYFAGYDGDPAYEIRPVKSKSISGGNVTIVIDSWKLLDPDLWNAYPTSTDWGGIDVTVEANHVASVEVYREYNDPTTTTATLYWEPTPSQDVFCAVCGGSGCSACALTTQNGCMHVRDPFNGRAVVYPATYSDGSWNHSAYTIGRDPDFVKVWYRAGKYSQRYLSGFTHEPLDPRLARAIAYLATARMERDFCSCPNVTSLAEQLRLDRSFAGPGGSYQISPMIMDNPFGTRGGEIRAWNIVNRMFDKKLGGAVV